MKNLLLVLIFTALACSTLFAQQPPPEFSNRNAGGGDPTDFLSVFGTIQVDGVAATPNADWIALFDPNFNTAGLEQLEDGGAFGTIMPITAVEKDIEDATSTGDEGISGCMGTGGGPGCEGFYFVYYQASSQNYYIYPQAPPSGDESLATLFDYESSMTNPTIVDGFADPTTIWNFSTTNQFVFPTALPIVLLSFDAISREDKVSLEWMTAVEENNDYFTIERSTNGTDYDAIGRVQGAGNSSTPLTYSFDDNDPLYGTTYYRLKQTDYDGQFTYSPVRTVERDRTTIGIHPNPTNADLYVTLPEIDQSERVTIRVFNHLGQNVRTLQSTGEQLVETVELADLPSGTYVVRVRSGAFEHTEKFVKL